GSRDRTVRLWDPAGKRRGVWEGHTGAVYAVALSADGRLAISGGNDKTVRLWDAEAGREKKRLTGHENAVITVGFAAQGRLLSASSRYRAPDRVVRVWDA